MSTVSNPAPVPQPTLSELFKTTDTNSDGVLSLEEVQSISERWLSESLASGTPHPESLRWHDANGDGNMSLAEMQAAQANPTVYKLKPGENAYDAEHDAFLYRIKDLFGFADQLGGVVDDLITAEEANALGLDFFKFQDPDGNGLMSRAEYEATMQPPYFGSAEQTDSITELRVERGGLKTDLAKYIFYRLMRGESVTEEELRYLESDDGSENLFAGDDWDTWMRFTQAQGSGSTQA